MTSIRIYGLAKDNGGLPVPISIKKEASRQIKSCISLKPRPAPPALPAPSPPSEGPRIELVLELLDALPATDSKYEEKDEDELGGSISSDSEVSDSDDSESAYTYRKKATVYSARALHPDAYTDYMPPLAVKIAAERGGELVAMEAGAYHVLETVQGLVVPRYYGYFRTAAGRTKTFSVSEVVTLAFSRWHP